jgi:hypothetical protein
MRRAVAAALLLAFLVAVAGCGSGGSSGDEAEHRRAEQEGAQSARKVARESEAAEAKAPPGSSPTLRAIYRSFPPPRTGGMAPAAARATEAGRSACKDKTPVEVKEAFYARARANLEAAQARIIDRIATYEAHAKGDRSFVAGQLAADTYAATQPETLAAAAYQGCIYSLVRRLERELAPAK